MTVDGYTFNPRRSTRTAASEVSFRLSQRNEAAQVPLTSWTEFATDGERVFIRTRRPADLLAALCGSGADLEGIEVRPVPLG